MDERPYTLLSCSISMDGYLDSAAAGRLILSNDDDLDRVDAVRAASDAILVGAETVRRDDPRLLVRDPGRVAERVSRGLTRTPTKVTLTERADLDPGAHFFETGDVEKLVYCPSAALGRANDRFAGLATVVDGGPSVDVGSLSEDLHRRGVRRLMVEGGGAVLTQFLAGDLADELQLVVAPIFVGDSRARRFVGDGRFPWTPKRRAHLADVRPIGDVVLLRYALSPRFSEALVRLD